jgi:hypothetical protein
MASTTLVDLVSDDEALLYVLNRASSSRASVLSTAHVRPLSAFSVLGAASNLSSLEADYDEQNSASASDDEDKEDLSPPGSPSGLVTWVRWTTSTVGRTVPAPVTTRTGTRMRIWCRVSSTWE